MVRLLPLRRGFLILLSVMLLLPTMAGAQNYSVGEVAPSFSLNDYNGAELTSDAYSGQILMIFFLGYG